MMIVYEYKGCSTCKKALVFLRASGVAFESRAIVETPPSIGELRTMLGYLKAGGGTFKSLFNVSGQQYRELGIAERLKAGLTEAEALALLSKNGKLIKRPFLLAEGGGAVGFNADTWRKLVRKLV